MILSGRVKTLSGNYSFTVNSSHVNVGDYPADNIDIITSSIYEWVVHLADSPLHVNGTYLHKQRDFRKLRDFLSTDFRKAITEYASLLESLLSSTDNSDGRLTSTFILDMLKTPIAKEYLTWYESHDSSLFQFMASFLSFGKKIEIVDPSFETNALRSWYAVEERIKAIDFRNNNHVPYIKSILAQLLPPLHDYQYFLGKHGSGAVAEPARGVQEKNGILAWHPKLIRALASFIYINRGESYIKDIPFFSVISNGKISTDVAVLRFVAKNFKTVRSICMEPAMFMLFQQHFRMLIENSIKRSALGHYVNINDQGRNRALALHGSRFNNLDTLDLSGASDSVSVRFVREVFPRSYRHALLSTRTSRVELPNGEIVTVDKFAPMGSALCFPVQTILYSAIVIYGYLRHHLHYSGLHNIANMDIPGWLVNNVSFDEVETKQYSTFSCYGDDIICDTRVSQDVMSILTELGFQVNFEKSFTGAHAVRESCGLFAIDGKDVTFFVNKQKFFSNGEFSARAVNSAVALCNLAGDAGYRNLQRAKIQHVLEYGIDTSTGKRNPIRFSMNREDGFSIYSKNPHNSHLEKRSYEDLQYGEVTLDNVESSYVRYQRNEVRCWVLDYNDKLNHTLRPTASEDSYYLHMFHRGSLLRGTNSDKIATDHKEVKNPKMSWGWTPTA